MPYRVHCSPKSLTGNVALVAFQGGAGGLSAGAVGFFLDFGFDEPLRRLFITTQFDQLPVGGPWLILRSLESKVP